MVIAFPFHAGDVDKLSNLLDWIKQLSGRRQHTALLVADSAVEWETCLLLRRKCAECFNRVDITTNEESVKGWPQGPNSLFLATANYCNTKSIGPWLWMETDAVPLHRDWADILAMEYMETMSPFMGCIYECNQPNLPFKVMSGVALYPFDAETLIGDAVSQDLSKAFDVTMTSAVLPLATHTERIQHFWGEVNLPPSFPKQCAEKHHFTLARFQSNAVVFHRNKDGTLIERLRERMGVQVVAKPPVAVTKKVSKPKLTIRRTGALGDALCATVVATKLADLGYDVTFQAHPSTHCILRRVVGMGEVTEPGGQVDADLDGSYEKDPNRKQKHFAQMFIERANAHLRGVKIENQKNFAPRMELSEGDRKFALEFFEKFPRPWVIVCPRSNSWANRTVPDNIWSQAAGKIQGTKLWLALHPAPTGFIDLNTRHFDQAICYLGVADLLVTVDTGPLHVAAALGTPAVAIQQASSPELHLSEQRDWVMISPNLICLNCNFDICPINAAQPPCQQVSPDLIANAANAKLQYFTTDGVSCVICIYKPSAEKLNHCLREVLPQVNEVLIVSDSAGVIPRGVMTDPKIRYIKARGHDLGYGRKVNAGFRQTNHRWVLLLNDDLYLAPDAVAKMREAVKFDTGIVAHELRYPDGTIQHGGTYRNPGDIGWGHLDHRATESRIKEPVEMENVCGASILVRRRAFYDANGYDEDFFLYFEDNAFCLAVRQAGWKVMYTPHAKGIHEESQSTSVTPRIHQITSESNQTFRAKWLWYFSHNDKNTMGTFQ